MLLIAGEWFAVWTLLGATLLGAGWKPFRKFRERAQLRKRLAKLCQHDG